MKKHMKEIPVFIINGFLESGKTTFINETLCDEDFTKEARTLLISCEEGLEEYDEAALARVRVQTTSVESQETLNDSFLLDCAKRFQPDQVMIEYNGMWKTEDFLELTLPPRWVVVQVITLSDASTFQTYFTNMRSILMEHMKYSDLIIFNRCDETTDRTFLRRAVKPINRKAQLVYEAEDGILDDTGADALPFAIDTDLIEICEDDFGLWYLDAMDYPERYRGKTVRFTGMIFREKGMKQSEFLPGRFAMTCCADDIAYIGFLCRVPQEMIPLVPFDGKERRYVTVTARVDYGFSRVYQAEGPILYAEELVPVETPKEKIVYFN